MATVVIALMQKYTREKRTLKRGESCEEFIQFRLYRVRNEKDAVNAKSTGKYLTAGQLERCGTSGPYINQREVTKRFRVPPGSYLIIPGCYDENINGEFLLRVYTEIPLGDDDCNVLHDPSGKDAEMYFSTPKSINNEFATWNSMINGPGQSRISNDMSKSLNTLTLNTNTMTNAADLNGFGGSSALRAKTRTSTPLYESKLYLHHAAAQVHDKVDVRELKQRRFGGIGSRSESSSQQRRSLSQDGHQRIELEVEHNPEPYVQTTVVEKYQQQHMPRSFMTTTSTIVSRTSSGVSFRHMTSRDYDLTFL
jgi:hypothetical protein